MIAGCNGVASVSSVKDCYFIDEIDQSDPSQTLCLESGRSPASLQLTENIKLEQFLQADQEEKMRRSIKRLMIVLNSKEFKERVLNHTYNGQLTYVDNGGLSNTQVYETIMRGQEVLENNGQQDWSEENRTIDLTLELYYKRNSTVGYTYPYTEKVWVNSNFFSWYPFADVAANVVHEWTHKLGFEHDFNNTVSRNYSVPYAVGTIVAELIREMTPVDEAEPLI